MPYAPAATLPPGKFLVLISVRGRPQDHSAAGRIRSIEKNPMTIVWKDKFYIILTPKPKAPPV
jgi:hypothetical protein